jgi:hypothetical protein
VKAGDFKYNGHRNSYTELNEVYFWTITINKWRHLLKPDKNKMNCHQQPAVAGKKICNGPVSRKAGR